VLLASKRRRHSDPTEASAQPGAAHLAPTIQELHAGGCESLRAIAAGLEERGIPTARGGKWSAVQVSRLLEAARQVALRRTWPPAFFPVSAHTPRLASRRSIARASRRIQGRVVCRDRAGKCF
jgi:hypothetical protein